MASVRSVCAPFTVPANSSRFMPRPEAVRQPTAVVELAWDPADPFLFNRAFDASLILHDDSYYTTVVDMSQAVQVPTLGYLSDGVLPHLRADPLVVDIGCGQGEFVNGVRALGVRAEGYDPVLRSPSEYLHRRYWRTEDGAADLFVLRCVLPHVPDPWAFLDAIGDLSHDALVLVEFQRLDWILDHAIWYQISHDHVNLFAERDLASRFEVVDQGRFSGDEWAWMLIRPSRRSAPPPVPYPYADRLDRVLAIRDRTLAAAVGRPLAIWGAAGKGIVLAHALVSAGAELLAAIDADPGRHGHHLEVSGLEVLPPDTAAGHLPADTTILVCNPNHLDAVRQAVGERWQVQLPSELR